MAKKTKASQLINAETENIGKMKQIATIDKMNLTKAEVIDLIPTEWNSLIKETKTCSKMPGTKAFQNFNGKGFNHCGICTACILRQISALNSKNDMWMLNIFYQKKFLVIKTY